MQSGEQSTGSSIFTNRRGMSATTALIVMVVVIIIAGAGAYAGLSSVPSSTVRVKTCTPVNSPACVSAVKSTTDVTLFIPYTVGFGQTYSKLAVGTSLQASIGVTGSEKIKTYAITWGPGITASSSTGSLTYTYGTPGLYTLVANATDTAGVLHTGPTELGSLYVNPSQISISKGIFPPLATTLVNSSGGPYGWVSAGGSVTVNGTYTAPPTNSTWAASPPTLTATGGTQSGLKSGATYVTATYTFANPGYYGITLIGATVHGTTTYYQNFTWGVFVGQPGVALGCALCHVPTVASPHPNEIYNYEVIPGGALDLDPAADYYSVGYEVGEAFDESLITFNGTDSGPTWNNFVPEVATCVPGSPQCGKLYGGDTLVGPGPGGFGQNVTFVIDKAAHFYDPYTGVGREVYPSDVMFSIIRAIFYTQFETVTGYYVGFDIAGPLVPYQGLEPTEVNSNWDLGAGNAPIHAPYNNTPSYTLGAFGVNDSNCPAIAMSQDNGCITFHASADNKAWPALLLILSIISADGIQEAGWYTQQGADVPGFDCPGLALSTPNPDLPCLLPGDTSTTNSTAYKTWVANSLTGTSGADSPYGWDPEILADLNYPIPVSSVSFKEVGSGPYYLAYANPGVGYTLVANPDYQAPTGCAGQAACLPLPHQYVQKVTDYWEPTDTVGIAEVEAGYADFAGFETTDYGTLLSLVANGQFSIDSFPDMTTGNFGYNTAINIPLLKEFDSSPPSPINIPSDAFSYQGLRTILDVAYPYATAQTLGNVVDGLDTGTAYGGFLPPAESAYYNPFTPYPNYNNVTGVWSDPTIGTSTTVGSAAWYWNQVYVNTSSPIYDPELTTDHFSASSPLYVPVTGFTSAPNLNAVEKAWGYSVSAITGGVIQFQQYFIPSTSEGYYYASPGVTPWPIWWFGWIPDYPAPVNNWEGAYGTGLWAGADYLFPTLGPDNSTAICGNHYNPTPANYSYWANQPHQVINQACQGLVLNLTQDLVVTATYNPNTVQAEAQWFLVQDLYNELQLTVGQSAGVQLFFYAPWINPTSINANVLIGGGGEVYYQQLTGNGLV